MEHLNGFAPLAERYEGFVLDLWGVIHDGVHAFPEAVDTLERLRAMGRRTLLLSNAPRPNATVQGMMQRMGIPDTLYTAILTSGEAVRRSLRDPPDAWWANLGRRVLLLGTERDRPVLEGLDYSMVEAPEDADFVLNAGPDEQRSQTDIREYEELLQDCVAHRLPMICANPDLEVIRGGQRILCAGSLALRYQMLGGDARSLGKPDPAIYDRALAILNVPVGRVLAVGDSLRTDVAGAAGVGLGACWVLGGLHGASLTGPDGRFDTEKAEREARVAGLAPIATVPNFGW